MKNTLAIFFMLLAFSACHQHSGGTATANQKPEADSGALARVNENAPEASMVGFIKNTEVVGAGETCSFYYPSDGEYHIERLVFHSDFGSQAWDEH